ncbi:MAG: AAA family ATPase [Planctomycetia bacterium]|nr:AAA family ATPase [Planctomycetia bacterium]
MYEAYFNLPKRPFSATPDPTCFFATEAVQELLDQLVLRAESGEGIGVVTGAAGTGKTLLCRRIAAELAPRMTPVFIANANFPTRRALLQSILFELGRKYCGLEEQELRLAVFGLLRELTLMGRGAVLIIDEAHLLNDRLLEELRLLACLAEEDQPLARVILAGQEALEERLTSPALEALNQRIACQLYLDSLSRGESIGYIAHRISWAGGEISKIFDDGALDRIASAAAGVPRCLNQLCDHALLLTYVQESPRVTVELVAEALLDLRQLPLHWNISVSADTSSTELSDQVEEYDAHQDAKTDRRKTIAVASPVASEEFGDAPAFGETVCFEVGSDVADTDSAPDDSESISLADEMTEEPVVDHYALLDAGMPRLARTFEDAPVPANWHAAPPLDVPAAPQPLAVHADSDDELEVGVDVPLCAPVTGRHPFLLDDGSGELALDESVDFLPDEDDSAALDAEPRFVVPAGMERPDIEERIGASVAEACREVHAAVGRWDEEEIVPGGPVDQWTVDDNMLEDVADVDLPEASTDYDVVQPEPAGRGKHRRDVADGLESTPRSPAGRYVPAPKYRMIFSTLRRRLGRGHR